MAEEEAVVVVEPLEQVLEQLAEADFLLLLVGLPTVDEEVPPKYARAHAKACYSIILSVKSTWMTTLTLDVEPTVL